MVFVDGFILKAGDKAKIQAEVLIAIRGNCNWSPTHKNHL
jgi:hypothetical protein